MRPRLELACLLPLLLAAPVAGCNDPASPRTPGSPEVTTTTSGESDGLSYSVQVDGSIRTTVAANGRARVAGLAAGVHPPGSGGAIQVIVTSTLINAGAIRSFSAVLDRVRTLPVPANGSARFTTVPAGPHSIRLKVPPYCAVGGFLPTPNPVGVLLRADGTVTVRFPVFCLG